MSADLSHGIAELAALIYYRVGAWHDLGYETPPAPHCRPIPPLGWRSAEAIKAGHGAVEVIDQLTRQLYALRQQLIDELRVNADAVMASTDQLLARTRTRRERAGELELSEFMLSEFMPGVLDEIEAISPPPGPEATS
jgi:hypothetical protein